MTDYLQFKNEPLNLQEITDKVTTASCGAISIFVGTTRDNFNGKSVLTLEYEAYESMGLKAMQKICADIRKLWPDVQDVAIHHRLGTVPIKEASVIIAISSPHREDAIKATEFCINSLKQSVPIWKKEIYKDNESTWKENKELSPIYPPKRKRYNFEIVQPVEADYVPPHLIQIQATKAELDARIKKFIERKRDEINRSNISEFARSDIDPEYSCARLNAVHYKRKDSKGHLQVERVLNTFNRDQNSADYMKRFQPPHGIEERLQNIECQLGFDKLIPKNIYTRLKCLEDRLIYLESLSPEYIQFWDKGDMPMRSMKKKVFAVDELDELIAQTEMSKRKKSSEDP